MILIAYDKYGTKLNSHDVFKLIALGATVVGHAGYFFSPEQIEFSLIGRIAMPIFLFLVGYSSQYVFSKNLLIFGVAVSIITFLCGRDIFALNILFSIIVTRFFLSWAEEHGYLQKYLFATFLMLCFWYIPIHFAIDYGSAALLFGLAGWIARKGKKNWETKATFIGIFLFQFAVQINSYDFSLNQQIILAMMLSILGRVCYHYRLTTIQKKASRLTAPLLFIARNSMIFYALHFAGMMIIARIWF